MGELAVNHESGALPGPHRQPSTSDSPANAAAGAWVPAELGAASGEPPVDNHGVGQLRSHGYPRLAVIGRRAVFRTDDSGRRSSRRPAPGRRLRGRGPSPAGGHRAGPRRFRHPSRCRPGEPPVCGPPAPRPASRAAEPRTAAAWDSPSSSPPAGPPPTPSSSPGGSTR